MISIEKNHSSRKIQDPANQDHYDDINDTVEVYIDYNKYADRPFFLYDYKIVDYYNYMNTEYGQMFKNVTDPEDKSKFTIPDFQKFGSEVYFINTEATLCWQPVNAEHTKSIV